MELKLTEKDKKLLIVLAVIVLVLGVGVGIGYPLQTKGDKLEKSVNEAADIKTENEQKIANLPAIEKKQQDLNVQIAEIQSDFYPMMKSMQIDQMLTETALSIGLNLTDLKITMPESGTYTTLTDYNTILSAQDAKSADQDGAVYDGVYTALADLSMSGSRESIQSVIDAFAAQEPKLRITDIAWQTSTQSADYSAEVKMEIYMYESAEPYLADQAAAEAEAAAEDTQETDTEEAAN
ncbi:MAG: hypothetical protein PHN80_06625 [Hespellia sp.]|nr:hypothetical protein [Hespellia sp.]